ncbi:MAG TPA: hypothetical protein VKD72_03670 [Gemmataceae bacterium]|nr:hypothetical protein [Gemmataceae bacterium]
MSLPAAWPQILDFFGTPLVIEPSPGRLASDAGLLPLRQLDQRSRAELCPCTGVPDNYVELKG